MDFAVIQILVYLCEIKIKPLTIMKKLLPILVLFCIFSVGFAQAPLKRPERKAKPKSENTVQYIKVVWKVADAIDLGLSVKWASHNVGAMTATDAGAYFAWGETRSKKEYIEVECITSKKRFMSISGSKHYDVARTHWGNGWRIPTNEEYEELISKCIWKWMCLNGINGYLITAKNGNSIFLPAAGWSYESDFGKIGECGGYWSSTPNENNCDASSLGFSIDGYGMGWCFRGFGHTVRPVTE